MLGIRSDALTTAAWLMAFACAVPVGTLRAEEPLVLRADAEADDRPLMLLPSDRPSLAPPVAIVEQPSPQPTSTGPLMLVASQQSLEDLPLVLLAAAREDAPAPEDAPRRLDQLRTDTRVTGEMPPRSTDASLPAAVAGCGHGRGWGSTCYQWEASALYHQPLYFEDVPLERYGQTLRPVLQPFASGAKFFASVPFLPYKAVLEPPIEHVYALGYYRPGSIAPRLRYRLPIRYDAAAVQAGIVVGLILVLP